LISAKTPPGRSVGLGFLRRIFMLGKAHAGAREGAYISRWPDERQVQRRIA